MKIKESLNFKFKGARTYVHGTDIFNKTVETIKSKEIKIDQLSMSINNIVKSNLDLIFTDENEVSSNDSVRFEIESNNQIYYCSLQENKTEVNDRYPYPEADIVNASMIDVDNSLVTLSVELEYSTIEKVVALNKGLMERLFPDANGKWYFVKLEVSDLFFENVEVIQVKLIRNMHLRLVKSSIEINRKPAGFIYFSLKK